MLHRIRPDFFCFFVFFNTDEKCASKRKVEDLSLNHLNYVMYLLRCSCVFVSQIIFITAGIIKLVA